MKWKMIETIGIGITNPRKIFKFKGSPEMIEKLIEQILMENPEELTDNYEELSPEQRILYRENKNRKVIAELKNKEYVPISMDKLKNKIGDAWGRLIVREAEQQIVKKWRDEDE